MKVTAPGVSRCLDNLEKAGLLTRVRENADRRQVRICFSAKGEKFIEKLVA
jgi:DNA-binding MarR family transcriptional regulator